METESYSKYAPDWWSKHSSYKSVINPSQSFPGGQIPAWKARATPGASPQDTRTRCQRPAAKTRPAIWHIGERCRVGTGSRRESGLLRWGREAGTTCSEQMTCTWVLASGDLPVGAGGATDDLIQEGRVDELAQHGSVSGSRRVQIRICLR